ncbi:MAG: metallophosphoesterase family protein [Planctomycetia bacterium]|nr:metallophosphoesterase family protein [Planctomycetia bacterium]
MRFAVISDIHNNAEAFRTTLEDIEQNQVEKIICLGDLVGYGPNPIECVDMMLDLRKDKLEACLCGNHDQAAMYGPDGFNDIAEEALLWTRDMLESEKGSKFDVRWDFIGNSPREYRKGKFLFVHGSPRSPINEYVFDDDVTDLDKMSRLFALVPQYCFMGHTHVPGVFIQEAPNSFDYLSYRDLERQRQCRYPLTEKKLMINVGSVGQPRDKDPRSCYVIVQYDDSSSDNYIEFRRVKYDVDKTIKDIENEPRLNIFPFLSRRLKEGR